MFRAWYQYHIFVKETRKEAYPAPPFCAPGLSPSLMRKTGRFGTLPSAPKFPRGKETRAGFQNRDFSDFCQFRSSENRVSEVFQARKTAKRQKNGNLRLAHHTPAASTPAGSMEAQRGWGVGGDAREGETDEARDEIRRPWSCRYWVGTLGRGARRDRTHRARALEERAVREVVDVPSLKLALQGRGEGLPGRHRPRGAPRASDEAARSITNS